MSFSLHSSSEYFGGSNSGSASSSFREPVKSSMGEMSVRVSAMPSSRNHLNESRWTATRSGRGMTSRSFANEKRCLAAGRAKITPYSCAGHPAGGATRREEDEKTPNSQRSRCYAGYQTKSSRLQRAHVGKEDTLTIPAGQAGCGRLRTPGRQVAAPGLRAGLLQLDRGASSFELGLRLLGVLLGDLLEDGLRRRVDQVLGLLEAEAGQGPDLLDDLDLLVAGGGEDDVELVLLLDRSRLGGPATGRGAATATGRQR